MHLLESIFRESSQLQQNFLEKNLKELEMCVRTLSETLKNGKKILLFGNGGSAADAQHIAAEFVNGYLLKRHPLPALALSTDTSVLTSIGNDFGFEQIFEKQIMAFGVSGDAAVGISTSGRSPNVVRALKYSRGVGLTTIGLGGSAESPMARECMHFLPVSGAPTPRIQEVHTIIGHALVEMVELILFGSLQEQL
jgi:D-sedoheptulose 7-phosphate isomerase